MNSAQLRIDCTMRIFCSVTDFQSKHTDLFFFLFSLLFNSAYDFFFHFWIDDNQWFVFDKGALERTSKQSTTIGQVASHAANSFL